MKITDIVKGGVYEDSDGQRFTVIQTEREPSGRIIARYLNGNPWPGGLRVRAFAKQMVRRVV